MPLSAHSLQAPAWRAAEHAQTHKLIQWQCRHGAAVTSPELAPWSREPRQPPQPVRLPWPVLPGALAPAGGLWLWAEAATRGPPPPDTLCESQRGPCQGTRWHWRRLQTDPSLAQLAGLAAAESRAPPERELWVASPPRSHGPGQVETERGLTGGDKAPFFRSPSPGGDLSAEVCGQHRDKGCESEAKPPWHRRTQCPCQPQGPWPL